MPVTVRYTLYYLRNLVNAGVQSRIFGVGFSICEIKWLIGGKHLNIQYFPPLVIDVLDL